MNRYIITIVLVACLILSQTGCISDNNGDILPVSTNQIVNPPYVPWWITDGTNGLSVLQF